MRPANGYITDARDLLEHDPNLRLRPNVADDATRVCTCKRKDTAPRRTLLESEKRASDEMRARVARQYITPTTGDE